MVYCTEELHEFKTKQGNYVMLYVNQTTLNDSLFFSESKYALERSESNRSHTVQGFAN